MLMILEFSGNGREGWVCSLTSIQRSLSRMPKQGVTVLPAHVRIDHPPQVISQAREEVASERPGPLPESPSIASGSFVSCRQTTS
ncbi:Streptomycin 6-kinase [Pseudomonas syringae pv. actinidiae]|uniref:Streptomycin 6-kinase n=1 Tax=Pseudomonas syringae pv. actinidiae TaxID=103796 RepID=A0A2V0QHX4_PSESF|nr:Streptomycin 6-kinase [Pseudomonas syringae pv. actinidiae]